ncbi:RagB/SusD family nutrient uptake outer membrane protein [Muricauda oceani]|uniref:RagB/SusD family nutrient uptake outer membrane protein n=1 Tax=Flagellimonas oceani TaxID=2698672 RepID=A0A6G7IZ09_9FLAO|nr:RagB/SusD family nutrient uptake outer membrane protein [Allomuricauda oceani]MBW8244847.1 RagB/SusD family nutrient uptake outer membrane protein [Allomuricauda oceani]QII43843.1 RagB/SusD family nutrient uptake outer membrane protein [Allomuricauda oceani]
MEKIKKYCALIIVVICVLALSVGCEDQLDEKTYTALSPQDFFKTAEDIEVVLNSVYGELRYSDITRDAVTLQEVNTDIHFERSGGIFTHNQPIEEFVWTSSHQWIKSSWERRYRGIYKANTVIDNISLPEMDENRRQEILAEARFLRAFNYYLLFDFFGPVPLITSSETDVTDRPERASETEMISFIESELSEISNILPINPPKDQYGRPTKGAALAALTKFYMMNKKWQEAANTAKQVMDLEVYDLFTEGERTALFSPENQRDNEFIFVSVMSDTPDDITGDGWLSHVVPRGYQWQYPPRQIFAAEYKIWSDFLELFDAEDERLDAFLLEFVNEDGETIVLGEDNARSLKFPEYPNQGISRSSDDFPFIRYADIILSRAEALNEINGLNQESVDLLNMIREAAGVSTLVISDFNGPTAFKDFILDERGREFHTEALRRQDLIRHGKFIEMAIDRGKPAQAFHVRYPIPQTEIERNPNLTQNEGY